MQYKFYQFWLDEDTLHSHCKSIVGVLKDIASRIKTDANQVNFYSVFGRGQVSQEPSHLNIAWSGESHSDDPNKYDVNIIMEPTNIEKRIVFCPLFIFESYWQNFWTLYKQPRPYQEKQNFCCFVVSNSGCHIRNQMFHKLSQYKKVLSMGRYCNNIGYLFPFDDTHVSSLAAFKCKFMLCFENSSKPYYLTEKLHNAWVAQTIPIYWGCTKVREWLNPDAFLYLEDTSDEAVNRLIQRIIELDNDHDKYMAMYNQPLLIGDIPEDLSIEKISRDIQTILDTSKVTKLN